MKRDTFTTTVDAAEAYERWYGDHDYDDGPDPADYDDRPDPASSWLHHGEAYMAADFDTPEDHGVGGGDPDDLPF